MKGVIVTSAILGLAFATSQAAAHPEVPLNTTRWTQAEVIKIHPLLRNRLRVPGTKIKGKDGLTLGRNLLTAGRPKDGKVVWNLVKEQATEYYVRLHPRSDEFLYWYYRTTRNAAGTIDRTWAADNVPHSSRAFYRCIVPHEGGRKDARGWPYTLDVMNRKFGGGLVDPDNPSTYPPGNDVLDPFQTRPAWFAILAGESPNYTRAVDHWTEKRVRMAVHPVTAARAIAQVAINPTQFATFHYCSG